MANKHLKRTILEVVENQLKENNPVCTRQALEQLILAGYTQEEAKEKIGAVVVEEIYDILKEGKAFDEAKYERALQEMVWQCINYEDCHHIPDQWDEISELVQAGYEALAENRYPVMTRKWMAAWELVKEMVRQAEVLPSIAALDEATDYEYELESWLQDMEMELFNAGEHEKRLQFCTEILELFDWEYNDYGGFKMAVGESLYALGRQAEGEQWFTQWLKTEPHSQDALGGYSRCLMSEGKAEKAFEMLKKEVGDQDCTWDNDILFVCLMECAARLGKVEEKDDYQRKYDQFQKEIENDIGGDWELPFHDYAMPNMVSTAMPVQQPIVKSPKIYPNDPCPCGSGKKYKKCCGRK